MNKLLSIQTGLPSYYEAVEGEAPFDKPWTTAIVKRPVSGAVYVGPLGLEGDGQADRENHGGRDKAVLFYAATHYPGWRPILGPGSEVFGAFGENLTVARLDEENVCIGDVWQVGDTVHLQVTQPRQPCWKLARRWKLRDLAHQVQENGRTGWYCRVLTPGTIEAGQTLELLERHNPEWTIAAANDVMHHNKRDAQAALALAAAPELSASWRGSLEARASRL